MFCDTALKLPNYLNALIEKSLTFLYSRRAAPKVPYPDNSERQPPQCFAGYADRGRQQRSGDALPDTDIIHCYHAVQW